MISLILKVWKYVWPEVRKYKLALFGILLMYTVRIMVDQILAPVYFKKLIDLFSSNVLDRSMLAGDAFRIFYMMLGLSLVAFLASRTIKFTFFKFLIEIIRGLRNFTFARVLDNSQSFFSNTFAGSLVTKARRFVGGFDSAFDIFLYRFFKLFVILIGVFVVLFQTSTKVAMVFLIWVPVHLVITSFLVKRKFNYDVLEAEQDSKISGRLADVFSTVSAVKFFSGRNREIEVFHDYTNEGARRSKKAWYMEGYVDLFQHGFIITIDTIAIFIMIKLWLSGQISTGTLVLVNSYIILIAVSLWDLSNALSRFMKAISDMKEMVDIFEVTPEILDPQNPEKLKMDNGHISFQDVSFKYKNGREVFGGFNLDIKPGEKVGLVGHSGAGKSTITSLILRLVDVDGGCVTIDGQDIRSVTQDDLRSVISYVPQDPALFHRTIKENIAYSKPTATEGEVIEAAKKAHAHEFIEKLQYGYDTYVGERGVKLSGGERQRVAIARVMLKDSPILILDEATSSLDSVSEKYIQESFDELMKGRTAIVIAHRLSTIQKMDRILVLDGGSIVEEGTHSELLAKKGFYANLWDHQTGGFLE